MDRYTFETRCWLDMRFNPKTYEMFGVPYEPYQPLFGIPEDGWNHSHYLMAARLARLLAVLESLNAKSFLDVGGAEGLVARVVRDEADIDVLSMDLSHEAGLRAGEYSNVAALAADSPRLPFADNTFEVVFLSEVLEHLANPMLSLLELKRVASKAVIITTEAVALSEEERAQELEERALEPHMDRSIFSPPDFELLLSPWQLSITNQCSLLPETLPRGRAQLLESLQENLRADDMDWPAHGVFVVALNPDCEEAFGNEEGQKVSPATKVAKVLEHYAPRDRVQHDRGAQLPSMVAEAMRCPKCRSKCELRAEETLTCQECSAEFPIVQGVVDFVTPGGDETEALFDALLEQRLKTEFPQDEARQHAVRKLQGVMKYQMPKVIQGDQLQLATQGDAAWDWSGPGAIRVLSKDELEITSDSILFEASDEDPQLLSPRIDRALQGVQAIELELAVFKEPGEPDVDENVQVFWWTLHRPMWWEAASRRMAIPNDGKFHSLRLEIPEITQSFPIDDELLRLRIDPRDHPGRFSMRKIEIVYVDQNAPRL